MLLGTTPESAAKGRTKVIISLISISLITTMMIAQDLNLIRTSHRTVTKKVTAKYRSRRIPRLQDLLS